jgi:acyl carrier protein
MKKEGIVAKITEGLNEVFPESEGMEVNGETLLDEIPYWDSMASVNLQIFLETAFGCSVPAQLLSGETPIGDIVEHIQDEGHGAH